MKKNCVLDEVNRAPNQNPCFKAHIRGKLRTGISSKILLQHQCTKATRICNSSPKIVLFSGVELSLIALLHQFSRSFSVSTEQHRYRILSFFSVLFN